MYHNASFPGISGSHPHKTHNPFSHGFRFSGKHDGPDLARLLNRKIFQRLNHLQPGYSPELHHARGRGELTPEVSTRKILDFIGRSVTNISDAEQYQQKLDKAEKGIEQGIDDVRRTLKRLGLDNEEIEQRIQQTRELLDEGLESLRQKAPKAKTQTTAPILTQSSFSKSIQKENSFSLVVQTQDGDLVTLDLVNQQGRSFNFQKTRSADGVFVELSAASQSASSLQFSVQGELDAGEMEALQELMNDVSKLANEFFQGDIDQTMRQALSLGFDKEELEGFSLNLKQTQLVEVNKTYNQISAPVDDSNNDSPKSARPDMLRFSDFVHLLKSIEKQQETKLPFGQSLKLFHDLFKDAVKHDQRFVKADTDKQENIENTLASLTEG